MRERPILFNGETVRAILEGRKTQTRRVMKIQPTPINTGWDLTKAIEISPYGQPGDRLWVRENFHQHYMGGIMGGRPCYQADGFCKSAEYLQWKPSIHMPRWASRISLEVVNIKVERLMEISHKDARSEGMPLHYFDNYDFEYSKTGGYQANFRRLWDQLNAKRGYSWGSNPWVWVIEFKRVEKSA